MKQIHGKLTPEKVDETMLVIRHSSCMNWSTDTMDDREILREQNELSEEIVNAITSNSLGNQVDETELEDELEALQEEALAEEMLKSGTVPVRDEISRMPAAANGEIKGKQQAIEEDDEEAELRKLQQEMAM